MSNLLKKQTVIHEDGTTTQRELGWVAFDRLEADKEWWHSHFSKLAQREGSTVQSVEVTHRSVICVHVTGVVVAIQYLP